MNRADRPSPLAGPYYWVPRPGPDGPTWGILTCHDLGIWDGISHKEFWPLVLEHVAAAWGKDAEVLKRRPCDHHTGLPRGMIVHPRSGYVVIHGDNAPMLDWLELVKARFGLTNVNATPEYTEHEGMIGEDPKAVQAALGILLDLSTKS